ncbi:MAG: hypothetical protein ACI8T1_002354 [Verrucomicrobiales bacterium]|jgi:hypothetical protein
MHLPGQGKVGEGEEGWWETGNADGCWANFACRDTLGETHNERAADVGIIGGRSSVGSRVVPKRCLGPRRRR